MIKSRYFPDIARCLEEVSSGNDKIEIPADVYDKIAYKLGAKKNFILRGDYSYETAKIFSQSGRDTLTFDSKNGEVQTESPAGISAELNFAFSIWNGYGREAAIERAILSRLASTEFLPQDLAEKTAHIKISDGFKVETNFAKDIVGKSLTYVAADFYSDKTVDVTNAVEVSKISRTAQIVKDFFYELEDEIFFVFNIRKDISDLFKGRISVGQFFKNATVTATGMFTSTTLGTAGMIFSGNPITAAQAAQIGRLAVMEKMKKFLDIFIDDDSKKILAIIGEELSEMLSGNFLTQYELEILTKKFSDDLNKDAIKDMFAIGNLETKSAWAQKYLAECLKAIFEQRIFFERPSPEEWHEGLQRVLKKINDGEDITANMERQREEALERRREFFREYKLKLIEIAPIIRFVNDMNRTQIRAERTLGRMQHDELHFSEIHSRQLSERTQSKNELRKLLAGMGGRNFGK